MSTVAFSVAGIDGDRVNLTSRQLEDVSSKMSGPLLISGDDGWDDSIRIWNAMVATKPALVIQPESASDVSTALRFAHDRAVRLSVKGGGHNIAGTAIADDGLTLDMARMRRVEVLPDDRLVHVGAGCLLGDVDRATQEHGLATPLGFVSETGVAGLTLGGGFGYLTRRFGWAVDNLAEVEIVTADGAIRTASREENADLFWAVRGGGGNFGVVTRFTFRLHEVGPTVTGGLVIWDGARTDDALDVYQRLTESAPRELTAALMLRAAPPAPFVPDEWVGKRVVGMLLCYSGRDPEGDLRPLRSLGDPIADLVSERPYVVQQSMLDATEPKGLRNYWKTEFLPGVSGSYLATFRDHATRSPNPLSFSVAFHLSGALNERDTDDGAVGNRDAHFVSGFSAMWPSPDDDDEFIAWARSGWEAIRPYSTGGNYVNFQLAEDGESRTAEAYRENFDRLRRIKAHYDPDNLFRSNRNITPSAHTGRGRA